MSGLFKSTLIKGNKLTDFTQTTATVGVVMPFGYGRYPVDGNVGWAPLPPKENRTVKRQGKGGVKQETFTYTLSYAIYFGRGPCYGFWWIKRNGKVVYTNDPNAPIEDKEYAAKWMQKATFYYGTMTQLPDSTIESYEGSGQVSAFRGDIYIVVEEDDVTSGGGAVPSYEAVPIATPPEVYFTSKPYAQAFFDEARTSMAPTGGLLKQLLFDSDMQEDETLPALAPTGGALFEVPPPEFTDEAVTQLAPTGGELKTPPPQNFADAGTAALAPTGGQLKVPPVGTLQKDEVLPALAPTGGELYDPSTPSSLPVVFELAFAGADGSTAITETGGKTVSVLGGAQIDTSLGDQRGLFDGAGDYLTSPHHADLVLTGDFDIEFTIRYNSVTGYQTLMSKGYTTVVAGSWLLQTLNGNGRLAFYEYVSTTAVLVCQESVNMVVGTDYSVRISRRGSRVWIIRDGVVTAYGLCTNAFTSNSTLAIGGGNSNGFNNYWFNGWFKSVKIRH